MLTARTLKPLRQPKLRITSPFHYARSIFFQDGLTVLEALSASGLRSIRYAKEVPGVREIIANDLSEVAVSSIRANVAHNGMEYLVTTSHDDAV
jgi:tRNA (guanine26-N2/guanine27-N2)-dimethyltransferase